MITFLLITLISIFKAIADTIKPDQFADSIWSKWTGNKWIDTRISMSKNLDDRRYLYMWKIHFKDPWHLSNSLMLSCVFIGFLTWEMPLYFERLNIWIARLILFVAYWLWYGFHFEIFRNFFKQYRI